MFTLSDNQFKNGCIPQPSDERDLLFDEVLGAGPIFSDEEWDKGYDIEKELGITLNPNNQYSSYSCVGQAYSKYAAVLNFIETGKWEDVSAKAIYSQISLGYARGAYLRDGAKLIVNWGAVTEAIVKSYRDNGTTDEQFMLDNKWLTPEMIELAKNLQSKEYRLIQGLGIDYFARAIKDGHGMVAGVVGTNNNSWTSVYPNPPELTTNQGQLWGHAIYFGKVRRKNGKKEVGFLNSWGPIGERGWQWLTEDWFKDNNRWVFNPWVLIDKANLKKDMITIKKAVGKPEIYIVNEEAKTKMKISCMEAYSALKIAFTEVESLDEYKDNGTYVWTPYIF